jgi:hypothetical protein
MSSEHPDRKEYASKASVQVGTHGLLQAPAPSGASCTVETYNALVRCVGELNYLLHKHRERIEELERENSRLRG